MKRYICAALSICLLLSLLGCTPAPSPTETNSTTEQTIPSETTVPTSATSPETQADSAAVYEAPMAAVALPLIVQSHQTKDGKEIAYYTHQDVSVSLPDADVAQEVTLDLLNRIDKSAASAEIVFTSAENDFNEQDDWYPYSYAIVYQPMRLDENILSLFGTETSFDGSPRSIHNAVSVSYDLTTGEPLNLRTVLHEENFADAMCDLILEGLKPSADSLFADYETIVRDKFSTNVPVSSWYFSNDGLCFYFAPYEIAPYSAGTIVSEIPYDRMSGLLKDAYFPGEQLVYSGTVLVQALDDSGIDDSYTQFAETVLNNEGKRILISSDGSISNVKLELETAKPETGVNRATILTLAGMGPTDAIVLKLDLASAEEKLSISFDSYGNTETLYLKQDSDGTLFFSK